MTYTRHPRPNSVTINFDPVAWEKLTSLAMSRKDSREKIVYLATLKELALVENVAAVPAVEEPELYNWKKVKAFPPLG